MSLLFNTRLLTSSKHSTSYLSCNNLLGSHLLGSNVPSMKAMALMVFVLCFLTSVLTHAEHLVSPSVTAEQQDCHLCNQGIDTPPELPHVQAQANNSYSVIIFELIVAEFKRSNFVLPSLRAPPFIQ